MRVAVVANPTSGRGKGGRLVPGVRQALDELGLDYDLHLSTSGEDAEAAARRAVGDGADVVASVGGDGHTGNVANGVIGSKAALAVVPTGTGNDFARYLGLNPKDPLSSVRLLADPTRRRVDVVRVETPERERYFVNVAGTGFDSQVNAHANGVKFLSGTLKYVYSTVVTLVRFKAGRFHVEVDGQGQDVSGMLVAVGNAISYGGGMKVTPDASVDDGMLDLCILGELSKPAFLKTFPKVFSGRHVSHPSVRMARGKVVEISSDRYFEVWGDGERMGPLPATFTVVPQALDVIVPPAG